MTQHFDENILTEADWRYALGVVPQLDSYGRPLSHMRDPDEVLAPAGFPYLYRWHLVRGPEANTYFHIQVANDPKRPLHDHPWDNQSVILAGGYTEMLCENPDAPAAEERQYLECHRKPGDVVWRKASYAHRLLLPEGTPYTMTMFSTGPKVREWGFWYPDGWKLWTDVTRFNEDIGQWEHAAPQTEDHQ
jgi:hypothetical protein